MRSLSSLLILFISSLRFNAAAQDWDFLIYTQNWPAAVCRAWKESDPSHSCALPEDSDAWTIHGIWPSVPGPISPSFCNLTWLFDPEEVKSIESDLEQNWIGIENGTHIYDLWAHEWNKHGTCAAQIEPLNSQLKYFTRGLRWLQQYTMTFILSEANIVPSESRTYSLNAIYHAIKNKLGADPEIYCKHDRGVQFLWEIRLCFSKALEVIDCISENFHGNFLDSDLGFISNCNSQEIVYTESAKPPNSLRFNAAAQDWDFLIYTQCWPAVVCREWKESDPSHSCALPEDSDAWTIHGIWPSVPGPISPSFCNLTWLFDPEEVKSIQSDLEQSWIDIKNGTHIYDLWSYEWNKHGTCAAQIEPLNSQIKYFTQGLRWLQQYTMTSILSEANIVPSESRTYSLNAIYHAIKNKLGADPEIYCKHDRGVQFLWEIRLCFSKALEVIGCNGENFNGNFLDSDLDFISNCNSKEIVYMESVKPL